MYRLLQKGLKKGLKIVLMSLGALLLLAIFVLVAGNVWVLAHTSAYIERDVQQCGPEQVAIVFGTSNWTRSGARNPHFNGRMLTAANLIDHQQVHHLLISGDNRTQAYNEPRAMWRDLNRRGVMAEQMTMDFAGFSTFDTLSRAQGVFKVEKAVLVTQAWHLPRAVYIGRALGMEVRGCAALERPVAGVWRLKLREWVARVATLGDLYLWRREPYFLGPVEPLIMDGPKPYPLEVIEEGVEGREDSVAPRLLDSQ
ncbi:ElyC/SanA/YdcF family protein [Vreelandella rituensis]|uniref:SanA-like protein n=1 Tax=Vreelandella rituensis TaxID=2282306 RepID=A0A368U5Q0_9GAMM|nr:ElyC/SanA/YdcF family protein [Halomonas rituensis]RCV91432.1 sanA-like protein [Halomonas rituensis]